MWIRVDQSLPNHPKTRKLGILLGGVEDPFSKLIHLWLWCLQYADDGDLSRYDDIDIAIAASWGDTDSVSAADLVNAMVQSGWLDRDGDTLTVHDWDDYQGPQLRRREGNRRRQRAYRDSKRDVTDEEQKVTRDVTDEDALRNSQVTPLRYDTIRERNDNETSIDISLESEPKAAGELFDEDEKDPTPYREIQEILRQASMDIIAAAEAEGHEHRLPGGIKLTEKNKRLIAEAHGTRKSQADHAGVMERSLDKWREFVNKVFGNDWWCGRSTWSGFSSWAWAIRRCSEVMEWEIKKVNQNQAKYTKLKQEDITYYIHNPKRAPPWFEECHKVAGLYKEDGRPHDAN